MALNCQVYDCIYNEKGGKCFAKNVMIGNRDATTSAGTTCNSYVSNHGRSNTEFANEFMDPDKLASDVNNIKCSAMSCRYNLNQDCTAMTVEINNENANCETFAP